MRTLASVLLLALIPVAGIAGQFDNKTPDYYTKKFGEPKFIRVDTTTYFETNDQQLTAVKSPPFFNVQEFRAGDVSTSVTFFSPAMKFAVAKIQRKQKWTTEQMNAALAEYGGNWKVIIAANYANALWRAADGSFAAMRGERLEIHSKAAIDMADKAYAAAKQAADAQPKPATKKP